MADLKISQLSAATALAGTEVVPVVQGGSTKKATIDQILAPAAGKGVDFSANGGNLLNQYDEGIWTPVDASGAGLTLSGASGFFTRIGRLVTVSGQWTMPSTADASNLAIGGLPFTAGANSTGSQLSTYATGGEMALLPVGTKFIFFYGAGGVRRTNANYTTVSIYFSASYIV